MVSNPPNADAGNNKASLVHASWAEISGQKIGDSAHFMGVTTLVKKGDNGEILFAAG
jgi:hypothetical protein